MGTDPTVIVAIAVTVDDIVTALETNRRSSRQAVLRITPPFSGRTRARLHRPVADAEGAIHLDPEALVDDPPSSPTPDETAAQLRAADRYTTNRHRKRHTAAVDDWRSAVRDALVDHVVLPTSDGGHRVVVAHLG
ncbi:hypothetical protein [Haloplanus halobius]|uniref:hypothetical protein n=1 Tax=Haloplanus halobius TaxID=2934938 RepID=UPI003CE46F8E